MKGCIVRIYNSSGMIFSACPEDAMADGEFTDMDKLIGEGFNKPKIQPLDTPNTDLAIYGTVKDLGSETPPYKVRVWLLVEYEPKIL